MTIWNVRSKPHICLYRDKVEIVLLNSNKKILLNRELYGYSYDAYIYTAKQEFLEKELIYKNVKIIKPLNITDYQNKKFVIEDLDDRWIAFGLKTNS